MLVVFERVERLRIQGNIGMLEGVYLL